MRNIRWGITLLLGLLSLSSLRATGDSTRYLTLKDTIFITLNPAREKIFTHVVEPKQTLFSLARFYGLSVEELYFYNPGLKDDQVRIGQHVQIPIPNRSIIRYRDPSFVEGQYVPVVYVVQRGDTMFSICRRLFRMPIDTVMRRSNLPSDELKAGQLLHIGWMSIDGIPDDYRQFRGSPLARRNEAMRAVFMRTTALGSTYTHNGAAVWRKDAKQESDFYALHRFAPPNSVIEVVNPMNNYKVYVKVIGKIPETAYDDDVAVILSPLSARALAAKDPRFFVRVTYGQ